MKTFLSSGSVTACLLATASFLHSQTANPNNGLPQSERDVIELDEFNVSAEDASGYRATNSITATGIGTRIMDVPIPINILTKDFIQDTNITEMREAMEYVPGIITTPRNESEYTVRGFTGNISYRNGQYRRQNYTAWNMDRVEVTKGPAAVFFGAVRDGGVINYITTRPVLDKTFTDVNVAVGSYDHYKAGFFHNFPLNDRLAFRIGAGILDQKGKAMYDYRYEHYVGASMLWKVAENHQIVLDLEAVNRNNYMMSSRGYAISHDEYLFNPSIPLFNANGTAYTSQQWLNSQGRGSEAAFNMFAPIYPDPNDPYGRYWGFSPDSYERFKSRTVDLEYLGRFGENIVWSTQLNYAHDGQPGMRSNNGDTTPLADGTVLFRFEEWNNIRDSYNMKHKLTWRFDVGATSHTLQLGYDYQEVNFDKPGVIQPNGNYGGSKLSNFIHYDPMTDGVIYGEEEMAKNGVQDFNVTRYIVEKLSGAYIVNQTRMFEDKLHLLYGVRRNWLSNNKTTYSVPVNNAANTDDLPRPKGWTPQGGIVFQPKPDLSFFAVWSQSIQPNFQVDADGNTAKPRETTGVDIGIKTDLLGGRISSTLTYYTLEKTNLTTRDTEREIETGRSPWYFYGNTQESEGIELDLNLSPVDNYQLVLGYSHMFYAKTTESSNPALIGRALTYTPEDKVTMWNRYRFDRGPLKDVVVGLGGQYVAAARMTGNPNNSIVLPSYVTFDFMASHTFNWFDRNVKAQLNVKNLTNKDYRAGSVGHFAPERNITLSLSTRF